MATEPTRPKASSARKAEAKPDGKQEQADKQTEVRQGPVHASHSNGIAEQPLPSKQGIHGKTSEGEAPGSAALTLSSRKSGQSQAPSGKASGSAASGSSQFVHEFKVSSPALNKPMEAEPKKRVEACGQSGSHTPEGKTQLPGSQHAIKHVLIEQTGAKPFSSQSSLLAPAGKCTVKPAVPAARPLPDVISPKANAASGTAGSKSNVPGLLFIPPKPKVKNQPHSDARHRQEPASSTFQGDDAAKESNKAHAHTLEGQHERVPFREGPLVGDKAITFPLEHLQQSSNSAVDKSREKASGSLSLQAKGQGLKPLNDVSEKLSGKPNARGEMPGGQAVQPGLRKGDGTDSRKLQSKQPPKDSSKVVDTEEARQHSRVQSMQLPMDTAPHRIFQDSREGLAGQPIREASGAHSTRKESDSAQLQPVGSSLFDYAASVRVNALQDLLVANNKLVPPDSVNSEHSGAKRVAGKVTQIGGRVSLQPLGTFPPRQNFSAIVGRFGSMPAKQSEQLSRSGDFFSPFSATVQVSPPGKKPEKSEILGLQPEALAEKPSGAESEPASDNLSPAQLPLTALLEQLRSQSLPEAGSDLPDVEEAAPGPPSAAEYTYSNKASEATIGLTNEARVEPDGLQGHSTPSWEGEFYPQETTAHS